MIEIGERRADPSATPWSSAPVQLSVVAPVYDEEPNLRMLHQRIVGALGTDSSWELLLVDDGSRDGSARVIRELSREDPRVRGVFLEHNCGQTSAICAGIRASSGALVATIDADLQNDPADLPGLVAGLGEHDAIVGYRVERCDSFVRRASSRIANRIRNWVSGDDIRDTGCSLKVFRRQAISAIPLFDGMHRFLPTLLRYHGFSVIESPVSHGPRVAGESKYGIRNRAWRALVDLIAVRWMRSRIVLPPLVEAPASAGRPDTEAP